MKFVLQSVKHGCRLGQLVETGFDVGRDLATPMCLLYTRGGMPPHLTRDLLDRICNMPGVAQMPLTLLAENVEIIKQYGHGIGSFAGMKDFIIYCCLQDSAELVPTGYNCNAGTSVWGRGGKMTLNASDYMKAVDAVRPDWYQALCDSDTDHTSSRKRIRKSVDRTLLYTDQCLEQQSRMPALDKARIIGVIEGGFNVDERKRSAQETIKRSVSGFSIEGFHSFGPDSEHLSISTIRELLQTVVIELPDDKPRLLPGIWKPLDILEAVRLGIDVFDSTYPYILTSRGSAMVFNYDRSTSDSDECIDEENVLEISLKDEKYSEDLRPVMRRCHCYTCMTHTRAYIHHLLNTTEILASVLLMMHNFHHYFGFFQAIRSAIADDSLDCLHQRVISSCHLRTTPADS